MISNSPFNNCVAFCLNIGWSLFFAILGHTMNSYEHMTPKDPACGYFEPIRIFSPEVLAEVGRKSKDLSGFSKKHELEQHIHDINFPYL